MKKVFRVKKNEDFQKLFKDGNSFANRQFVVYFIKDENLLNFKYGISVGKKLGNAVERNRIKRRIREVVRKYKDCVPNHIKFVIIARKPCVDLDFKEFKKCFDHLITKSKIIISKKNVTK